MADLHGAKRTMKQLPKKLQRGFNRNTINALIEWAQEQKIMPTPTVRPSYTTRGVQLRAVIPPQSPGDTFDTWTYMGYRFKTSRIITIKARSAIFHSANFIGNVAQQNVLLSGSSAWVYAEIDRTAESGLPVPVRVADSRPSSDQTFLNWALYWFDLVADVYVLGHVGAWDLNVDSPIANT